MPHPVDGHRYQSDSVFDQFVDPRCRKIRCHRIDCWNYLSRPRTETLSPQTRFHRNQIVPPVARDSDSPNPTGDLTASLVIEPVRFPERRNLQIVDPMDPCPGHGLTEPPTTPAPVGPTVAAGWRPAEMIPQAVIPPFDSSWAGVPSPPIVDQSAQIPDGVYWVDFVAQDGVTLTLDLGRFEACSILDDEFLCGPGPYGSNAIGTVLPAEGEVAVSLDDTTRVVIDGWDCDSVVLEGNGADLGAMYAALSADYNRAFTEGLDAGADPFDLMVAARDDPSTGFAAPPAECDDGYSLVWRFGDGPPCSSSGSPTSRPAVRWTRRCCSSRRRSNSSVIKRRCISMRASTRERERGHVAVRARRARKVS